MKKVLYIFIAIFVVASMQSCKRISGEDGDLLNNLDANQGGLTGARFLYQEVNSIDTIAQYNYSGLKLVEVLGDKAKTKITYNGELIYRMNYDGVVNGDSTSFTRFFTYDVTGKYISTISEVRSFYGSVHGTTPAPVVKTKALHTLTYNADKDLSTITSLEGKEISGTPFAYTNYEKYTFTYNTAKTNIATVVDDTGTYSSGVYSPVVQKLTYSFTEYDDKISPYTLLPFGYKVSRILDDSTAYYYTSTNNPKKITVTTNLSPFPVNFATTYTYDPQNYAVSGFGVNYDYRPF
jgi:hypothetical protein